MSILGILFFNSFISLNFRLYFHLNFTLNLSIDILEQPPLASRIVPEFNNKISEN